MSEEQGMESTESAPEVSTEESPITEESSEVEGQLEGETEEGAETSAEAQEATEEEVQLYEAIIDGESRQVPLDELIQNFQLKQSSNKKFQEAAAIKKQAEELQQKVLSDPIRAMAEAGVDAGDIKNYVYQLAHHFLQEDEMPEEERRAIELQKREQALKSQEEQALKARETAAFQAQQEAAAQMYQTQFQEALASSKLPNSPEDIAAVAQIMADNLQYGLELSLDDAIGIHKENQQGKLNGFLKNLKGDQLLGLLGDDILSQIRKEDVAKIKNPEPRKSATQSSEKPKATKEKISMNDFFKGLT